MRSVLALAAAALAIPSVSAHYTFNGLLVNGEQVGKNWQYIREHTRGYMPTFNSEAATSDDFRCNKGAGSGANTDVYTVKPGDEIGFHVAFGAKMGHPGPTQVYLSKAPGSVKEYDGSGDWIKIHQGLICEENPQASDLSKGAWCLYDQTAITVKLPDTIPDGEYLLRAEHIALHRAHVNDGTEFYYSCAQIKVEGSSASSLPEGPTAKIPGVYKADDPAVTFSVWGGKTEYPYIPGIEVAAGGSITGSKDGSTGDATVQVDDDASKTGSEEEAPSGINPVSTPTAATAGTTTTTKVDISATASTSAVANNTVPDAGYSPCRVPGRHHRRPFRA